MLKGCNQIVHQPNVMWRESSRSNMSNFAVFLGQNIQTAWEYFARGKTCKGKPVFDAIFVLVTSWSVSYSPEI